MTAHHPAPVRLSPAQLRDHFALEPAPARRIAMELRRMILNTVPSAAEALRFRCLCYFHSDAFFGSIGGNICLIECGRGRVALSFLHGASLPDPGRLLQGKAKAKRFVPIPDMDAARDPRLAALVRAAAALKPWQD